jgi:uncharacterized membrane protein
MATAFLQPSLRVVDLDTRQSVRADRLAMNDIGIGILELDRRIAVDRYTDNKETGSFILIDPETFDTVGMGIVDAVLDSDIRTPARTRRGTIADLLRSTESHARSIVKAASWRTTGSFDTFIIAALITGSHKTAGVVALIEILTKTALYYLHERIWILIPWGKKSASRNKSLSTPLVHARAGGPKHLGTESRRCHHETRRSNRDVAYPDQTQFSPEGEA